MREENDGRGGGTTKWWGVLFCNLSNGRHFYKFFFFVYKGKLRKTFEKVLYDPNKVEDVYPADKPGLFNSAVKTNDHPSPI